MNRKTLAREIVKVAQMLVDWSSFSLVDKAMEDANFNWQSAMKTIKKGLVKDDMTTLSMAADLGSADAKKELQRVKKNGKKPDIYVVSVERLHLLSAIENHIRKQEGL